MIKDKLIFLFLFILLFIPMVNSTEEKTEPSWVYLERAENLKEKGDYGTAFLIARKARDVFIDEKVRAYYEEIREQYKNKTDYELDTMASERKKALVKNDNYPKYHELMGDLYVLTNELDIAEKEYNKCLAQSKYFDYPQKQLEIKYKLADIYSRRSQFELADVTYREIAAPYFAKKSSDYWNMFRNNITGNADLNIQPDPTLGRIFKLYRIDGMEYYKALYKIGRRAALLQQNDDALFYLANAAIVWMTNYSEIIKKTDFDFQFTDPASFINYISNKKLFEYGSGDYYMDLVFFYIGYVNKLKKENKARDYYFNLAVIFSKNTNRTEVLQGLIEYMKKDPSYLPGNYELMY